MGISKEKLKEFANALIAYEFVVHHVDLHNTLERSTFLIPNNEGYKHDIGPKWATKLTETDSYVDKILWAIKVWNLADDRQKEHIEVKLLKKSSGNFEEALRLLFEEKKEEQAFNEIVKCIGQPFDVLGLIFFLYDPTRFMPIRSTRFDDRFALLDLKSSLAYNCSWEKYQEYNNWIREILSFLKDYINPEITLIDAHSFLWLTAFLVKFKDEKVSYLKYGKPVKDGTTRWYSCYITKIDKNYATIKVENDPKPKQIELKTLNDTKLFHSYKVDIYSGTILFEKVDTYNQEYNDELDALAGLEIDKGTFPSTDEVSYKPGAIPPPPEEPSKRGKYYKRDPQISRNALALAGYQCEIDPSHKTFLRKSCEYNYTEAHHLVPMAYQNYFENASLDREQNIVSLCSHCHNLIHYGRGADELVAQLFHKRKDLLESAGIDISEEQLLSLYK